MKKTRKEIINLLNRKNKKSKSINSLKNYKNNDKATHDLTRIPNIFNDHFAIVGQRLASRTHSVQNCLARK